MRRFVELAQFIQLHREVAGRLLSRQPGQAESAARLCAWVNQQLARLGLELQGVSEQFYGRPLLVWVSRV